MVSIIFFPGSILKSLGRAEIKFSSKELISVILTGLILHFIMLVWMVYRCSSPVSYSPIRFQFN